MDEERRGGSEPCFVCDVIGGNVVDRQVWTDVERFRRAERERLYQTRKAHRSGKREALTRAICKTWTRRWAGLLAAGLRFTGPSEANPICGPG